MKSKFTNKNCWSNKNKSIWHNKPFSLKSMKLVFKDIQWKTISVYKVLISAVFIHSATTGMCFQNSIIAV
jgi:hypothetical protein